MKLTLLIRSVRGLVISCGVAVAASLTGCAHPIVISPDVSKIERSADMQPLTKNAGYYIPPGKREQAVTTPGGGGDSVSYYPYRDIETAFYKMLTNVFPDVTVLKGLDDMETFGKHQIRYIIVPTITTSSSSSSPFTWPPTQFGLALTCEIKDNEGKLLVTKTAMGEGRAEFDEFKSDFALAGKRASLDALLKMQRMLLQSPELRQQGGEVADFQR